MLAGIGSTGHKGSFQYLLTEAALIGPLLPKSCHAYTIQSFNYTSDRLPNPACNYTTKEILVLQTQSLQLWKNAFKERSCENVCMEAHVYMMLLSVWSFVLKSFVLRGFNFFFFLDRIMHVCSSYVGCFLQVASQISHCTFLLKTRTLISYAHFFHHISLNDCEQLFA